MTSGSLWDYYRMKMIILIIGSINNNKTIRSKSSEYRTRVIGRTPADNNTLNVELLVSLKYLSNFWRFLDLPLINGHLTESYNL